MTELKLDTDISVFDGMNYTLGDFQVNFTQFLKGDVFHRLPDVDVHLTAKDARKLIKQLETSLAIFEANADADFIVHNSGTISVSENYQHTDYHDVADYIATLETETE